MKKLMFVVLVAAASVAFAEETPVAENAAKPVATADTKAQRAEKKAKAERMRWFTDAPVIKPNVEIPVIERFLK